MNKLNNIKRVLFALIMCLSLTLCGCGSNEQTEDAGTSSEETQQSEDVSAEEVMIEYGDAESFEAALNEGKNLEGKVVRFIAGEFHPDSKLGYNVWAGEHLNFVSSRNPDIQEGDTVTVRTITVENMMGSWVINYEKVDNAVVGEDTITYSKPKETTAATTTAKPKTTTTATTTAKEETTEAETSAPDKPAENKAENTYEHNEYYDIVETSSFQNSMTEFKRDFAILMAKLESAEEAEKEPEIVQEEPKEQDKNVESKPDNKNKIIRKYGSMVAAAVGVTLVNVAFISISRLIRK